MNIFAVLPLWGIFDFFTGVWGMAVVPTAPSCNLIQIAGINMSVAIIWGGFTQKMVVLDISGVGDHLQAAQSTTRNGDLGGGPPPGSSECQQKMSFYRYTYINT